MGMKTARCDFMSASHANKWGYCVLSVDTLAQLIWAPYHVCLILKWTCEASNPTLSWTG